MNRDKSFFKVLTHLISTKKYTNIFFICRSTGARNQIENFKQSLFPFFPRALIYNFYIFDVRPLALTYIKMFKIEVGLSGQIDQKLKCYFSNNLFLVKIFSIIIKYHYNVL